ncbi:MAG: dTMP kinase [Actinomycetota bacterium]|nr:dTMP kinase [Actinomycetota bacterium]
MTDLARRYIAFEGIEGAGKSTVARHVADHLRATGHEVVLVREPGGTEVGESIRQILLGDGEAPSPLAEAALFAASRAHLVHTIVRPALTAGSWVISDRTAYSSLAYQAIGRGLDLDAIRTLNDIAIGGLWPGTVVLLTVATDEGLARQAVDDRIGGEAVAFHRAVAAGFDSLAAAEPERFVVVDASKAIEDVAAAVIDRLGL